MNAILVFLIALTPLALQTEDKTLAGKWTLVTLERDGKADESMKGATRTHTGDKYTITVPGGQTISGTFKADAGKSPPTIDLMPSEGRYKGQTLPGIYLIESDQLKICFASKPGDPRPTDFAPKPGVVIAVHTRAKP
jgi:uncharacterized protein (TIGR03067 family)